MSIVYQKDKRSGITYAYESKAYWDKEKKQSRAKRTLLGRVDPETGEIVPTDGRNRRPKKRTSEKESYKDLYEKLLKKCESQEVLITALKEEVARLKGER